MLLEIKPKAAVTSTIYKTLQLNCVSASVNFHTSLTLLFFDTFADIVAVRNISHLQLQLLEAPDFIVLMRVFPFLTETCHA